MKSLLPLSLLLLLAADAAAEKLKGTIWDVREDALIVEGIPVQLAETARIERGNQRDVTLRESFHPQGLARSDGVAGRSGLS